MEELTVFLAPVGQAAGVLDTLADLSGGGLVDPFLWVTDGDHLQGGDHAATAIADGRRIPTSVQQTVADGRLRRVRLCVLVPLVPGAATVSVDAEIRLREVMEFQGGRGVRVTAVRCLLAPPGGSGSPDAAARGGWHNVLVAPEDSRGPDSGLSLQTSLDPIAIGRYAAPVVAGVVGLWTGMTATRLDQLTPPSEPFVRAARSFYRRVDAQAIERELRARVFATQPDLPQPKDRTTTTVYIEQPAIACTQMANGLWARHGRVLRGERKGQQHGAVKDLGWWTAVKWLWGFLVAAVKQAPDEWYHGKVAQFSSAVAKRVHGTVFGADPAAYRVVVHGMTAKGPASWQEIGAASEYFDALNFDPDLPIRQEPRAELSPLWNEYVAGALTLCDAGRRIPEMPPFDVGGRSGVLPRVEACVPAPEDDFAAIPPHLAAHLGITSVSAGDVLGAQMLQQNLQHMSQDPAFALDANRTSSELANWTRRHAPTYAAQVGGAIATSVLERVKEIGWYLRRLQEAAAEEEEESAAQRKRRKTVARLMVVFAVIAFLVLAVTVGLAIAKIVSVTTALLVALAVVVWWFVCSLVNFFSGQRELFRTLTRRQSVLSEVDALRYNLRQSVSDLRRVIDAYGQYLFVTRVLGRFLRQPYGPPPRVSAVGVPIVRGLPRTTRIARAEADQATMGNAAVQLREDLFGTGWLWEPWQAILAGARGRLGARGHDLPRDPLEIFNLQGRPLEGSSLQVWGEAVVREGVEPAAGDQVWSRLQSGLVDPASPRSGLGMALLSSVRGVEEGAAPPGPLAEFLSGIDQTETRSGQRFLSDHFTAQALAREAPSVTEADPAGWRLGLSGARVLVQYTDAVDPRWFRIVGGAADNAAAPPLTTASSNGVSGRSPTEPPPMGDFSVDGPVF